MTYFSIFGWFSVKGDVIQKVQRRHDLIKAHAVAVRYATCNNAINKRGNWWGCLFRYISVIVVVWLPCVPWDTLQCRGLVCGLWLIFPAHSDLLSLNESLQCFLINHVVLIAPIWWWVLTCLIITIILIPPVVQIRAVLLWVWMCLINAICT